MHSLVPLDRRLAEALPEGTLFAVGGRVRDEVRSVVEGAAAAGKDLDYVVTGVTLDDLARLLRPLGRIDVVGAAFAVVKLTTDGETADLAVPRRDRSTGVGHREFDVESGPHVTLEEDLGRRDFRMNMLARALPSGRIVDPYGGEADIRARRIDLLTPAAFVEDPLRMLRAAQFAARFAYAPSPALMEAMRAGAPLVSTVSAERVHDEFTKLFSRSAKPSIGLEILREGGVLAHLWPELLEGVGVEQNEWHAFDVWGHSLATADAAGPKNLTVRLAALLHDVAKPRTKAGPHFYRHESVGAEMARAMLERFRFPKATVETATHLVRQHMYSADPTLSDAGVRRFIRRIGPSNIEHMFALRHADIAGSGLPKRGEANEAFEARVRAELERQPAFSVRDLAIRGDDVIATIVARGDAPATYRGDERVGAALRWLFEQVTDKPERNERSLLLQLLEQYLTRASRGARA
ncbi:MAG: HD domain-containing protein [Candidatus Eremiobacteraeota bacterium]|nr:HD domain-containing protein [Candidatus Eremiobacteraeota bacterium]MBV9055703.1 HD domain-containing protein [Candidatus Eremiobacteraeota bacterium]MBV9699211.1 HD domain-containing protein [Candidatus Eremiobacteraeota bacterium]